MEKQERVCIGIEWRRGWGQRVVVMRDYISAQVLFLFTYFLLQVEYLYLLVYETLDTLASKRSALPLFPPLFRLSLLHQRCCIIISDKSDKKGKSYLVEIKKLGKSF